MPSRSKLRGVLSRMNAARKRLRDRERPPSVGNVILQARLQLSDMIVQAHDSTVEYGPFKGLKLHRNHEWGAADRGAMILGLYEAEIQQLIASVGTPAPMFVNIGSADGYFGIGTLVSGVAENSYCFETSERARAALREAAIENDVSDRLTIYGTADHEFIDKLPSEHLRGSILLCDIEGGEVELFTQEVFSRLSVFSLIVIELHETLTGATTETESLIARAQECFDSEFVYTGPRDLSPFSVLRDVPDDMRWLICSEGRPGAMRWLVLMPKSIAVPAARGG